MKIKNLATLIFFVSATATFGQNNAESDDLANQPDGRKSRILLERAEQNRNTYPTLAREQIAEAIFHIAGLNRLRNVCKRTDNQTEAALHR